MIFAAGEVDNGYFTIGEGDLNSDHNFCNTPVFVQKKKKFDQSIVTVTLLSDGGVSENCP